MYSENGEDERGARPTNNAPDRVGVARQNKDGVADVPRLAGPLRLPRVDRSRCSTRWVVPRTTIRRFSRREAGAAGARLLPAAARGATGLEPADVAAVGLDFVPNSFVGGIVKKDAVLLSREGDFGFSPGTAPERRARRRAHQFHTATRRAS